MKHQDATKCLAELGHDTRLSIYRLLIKAGSDGMAVSELLARLKIPGSTLSHHLHRLMQVNLVHQQREGRVLRCTANYVVVQEVIAYLMAECCVGPDS
ncbi:helix-turn-helix transcriptional regulator [bacterium SCSIO 12696]|nr:helix-turn-helix transcriptional regulator [bacterium SCSIO 12696]